MSDNQHQELAGDKLLLRFKFCKDRYAHEVHLRIGSSWVCVLQSQEGSPLEDWPASPPLQSLDFERRGDRQLALLVGMAGQSHWSASIELDPASALATFDIACRVRGAPSGLLASSYRVMHGMTAKDSIPGQAVLRPDKHSSVRLKLALREPPGESRLELAEAGVRIVAVEEAASTPTRTIRWGYTLSCLENPDGD